MKYKQEIAFINREMEFRYLSDFMDKRPNAILFIYGPKSSGKTTLLYRFFERMKKKQRLDVKFFNLREILLVNYKDFLQIFFENDYSKEKGDVKEKREYDLKVFKLSVETLKGLESKELDPFVVMKREFEKITAKGIKPVIIIDELQSLDEIYMNRGRRLITELFNFFVAMTKESHLAHIIISSSDGYFIDRVYQDSRLKKSSELFEVNYLSKEDTFEWLLNLEGYSKIQDFSLTHEDSEKIWDTVGGSMWEINAILSELFSNRLDEVLSNYKLKMRGIIAEYTKAKEEKESILEQFLHKRSITFRDVQALPGYERLLQDMVSHNILYYDPAISVFYPQGRSMEWGIKLYFAKELKSDE